MEAARRVYAAREVRAHSPIKGVRIVLVGVNFAPEPTGIGPYTADLCHVLARAGADVTVVTGMPHYPSWSLSAQYRWRLRSAEAWSGLSITRVRHYVPRSQSLVRRTLFEATFAAGSYFATRRHRADIVLAVTPNVGAIPVAARLAGRSAAPLGVVVQDLVGLAAAQSGVRIGARAARAIAALEVRWLRKADAVAVVSKDFVGPLTAAGLPPGRIEYVPNYTTIEAGVWGREAARAALGWEEHEFLVVHTGNMGLKQDLGNVVSAACLAEEQAPWIGFVLVGDGSQRKALEALATTSSSLRLVPPVPREQYALALAAADVLLVNERPTVENMSLPSKLTSYFAASRPVVAATLPNSATAKEIRRSGAGVSVAPGDPRALLEELIHLAHDPLRAERLAANGVEYSRQHLNKREGRARLLRFVEALIERDRVRRGEHEGA